MNYRLHMPLRILLLLFLFLMPLSGQESSDLERIREEIRRLQVELEAKETQERGLLERVEDTDRKIGLQRSLIYELGTEIQVRETEIEETQTRLRVSMRSYERLKQKVAARMVAMYKRGRLADWEALFSLNSLNQAAVWLKYKKQIVENDRRNIMALLNKKAAVQRESDRLTRELAEKNRLMEEMTEESRSLETQKEEYSQLLASVLEDKEAIEEQIRQKQSAFQDIRERIRLEEERRREAQRRVTNVKFAHRRGSLSWPLHGEIVTKYGHQTDPATKIVMEVLGIDIRGREREMVRAVGAGTVLSSYWMRGMGNLVLLDHGGGYITVYGYLDVLFIQSGESVEEGEIIGQVGDRSTLHGPTLHFEVWYEGNHHNPEDWLNRD